MLPWVLIWWCCEWCYLSNYSKRLNSKLWFIPWLLFIFDGISGGRDRAHPPWAPRAVWWIEFCSFGLTCPASTTVSGFGNSKLWSLRTQRFSGPKTGRVLEWSKICCCKCFPRLRSSTILGDRGEAQKTRLWRWVRRWNCCLLRCVRVLRMIVGWNDGSGYRWVIVFCLGEWQCRAGVFWNFLRFWVLHFRRAKWGGCYSELQIEECVRVVADGDCDDGIGFILHLVEWDGDVVILEFGEQRGGLWYELSHQLIK